MTTTVLPSEPETYIGTFPVIAQGDSWFSFGSLLPLSTGNVLLHLNLLHDATIVDFGQPGTLIANMCKEKGNTHFIGAMTLRGATAWSAILVSGGGNDLISFVKQPTNAPLTTRILLNPNEWVEPAPGADPVTRYISKTGMDSLRDQILAAYQAFADLRGQSSNPNAPIIAHTYDYPTPRRAGIPFLAPDAWLYQGLTTFGIPSNDWPAVAKYFIDSMADFIGEVVVKQIPNMQLVNLRGTLVPADPNVEGPSNDWFNEIHPTVGGYAKLAMRFNVALSYL
jgi:hypothetical protein